METAKRLRAPVRELALVAAYARDADWLERWAVPCEWLTSDPAQRLYLALLERLDEGEVTPAAVARAAGIAPRIFEATDVVAVPPDVPGLVRELHRDHVLRAVHVLARALVWRAEQPGADPVAIGEELGALLNEAMTPCSLPRRRSLEVAA